MFFFLSFLVTVLGYSANELTAMQFVENLYAPGPATIMNDIRTGSRVSGIWDILATNVKMRQGFGVNDFYGAEEVAFGYVAHELSGFNIIDQIIFKSVTSNSKDVALFYETVQLHPAGDNYTSTGSMALQFKPNGKIETIFSATWNIEWNLGTFGASHARTVGAACYYGTTFCNATTDPLGHYTSMADCMAFMATIPLGNWGYLPSNTITCRTWNGAFAVQFPEKYCAAIGKTGGDYCFNRPASTFYPNLFL